MSDLSQIAVNILRDIKKLDPEAFAALVAFRTKVNDQLSSHPSIPVSAGRSKQVGLVSILNGILMAANHRRIATIVDNDTVVGFTVLEEEFRIVPDIDGGEGMILRKQPENPGPEKA